MPCIWGTHNKSQIFLTVAIVPTSWVVGGQIMQPAGSTFNVFQALVDTGASSTAISAKVAAAVGLQPVGKMRVFGVAGSQYHNFYTFHVGFLVGAITPATGAGQSQHFQGQVAVFNDVIQGAELALGQGGFEVLLGMDILGKGSLAVEGSGTFSFSF
jgi:hypothetical protein